MELRNISFTRDFQPEAGMCETTSYTCTLRDFEVLMTLCPPDGVTMFLSPQYYSDIKRPEVCN